MNWKQALKYMGISVRQNKNKYTIKYKDIEFIIKEIQTIDRKIFLSNGKYNSCNGTVSYVSFVYNLIWDQLYSQDRHNEIDEIYNKLINVKEKLK